MARYLVTSALPYANGPIHFGHVAGAYLPADVYVRWLRMAKGRDQVLYVCGTDEHGVAITLKAEQEGLDYRSYVDRWHEDIKGLFDRFGISFDIFSGTARCPQHADASRRFFRVLHERGFILERTEEQWFSEASGRFLPDRYLEGGCPNCGHDKARGDECPSCGTWIDARELVDPVSLIDGSRPVLKATTHWYLDLPKLLEHGLGAWYAGEDEAHPIKGWKPNVDGYVQAMLADLHERPITRDLPWGVPLPEEIEGGEGKVLYVWFDAPIGYLSATMEWAEAKGEPEAWRDWWQDADTRLVHFIGKDNIAFHVVVFPSMLLGQGDAWEDRGFVLPWSVPANEFYNLQGRKFSTSSGWYLDNERFFSRYDADAARFHVLLSSPETADSEFSWQEFQVSNNALLADKLGNLASRVLKFAAKRFDNRVPAVKAQAAASLEGHDSLSEADERLDAVGAHLEAQEFRKACQALIAGAAALNQFFDAMEPWKLVKAEEPADRARCAAVIERCIAYLERLSRQLAPFCPAAADRLRAMLGEAAPGAEAAALDWPAGTPAPLEPDLALGEAGVLFRKIEDEEIAEEIALLEAQAAAAGA
jgi:methionyl-tRNA synthetase